MIFVATIWELWVGKIIFVATVLKGGLKIFVAQILEVEKVTFAGGRDDYTYLCR